MLLIRKDALNWSSGSKNVKLMLFFRTFYLSSEAWKKYNEDLSSSLFTEESCDTVVMAAETSAMPSEKSITFSMY